MPHGIVEECAFYSSSSYPVSFLVCNKRRSKHNKQNMATGWSAYIIVQETIQICLEENPYYLTIALSSCFNNGLYALALIKYLNVNSTHVPNTYMVKMILPISVGRALAIVSSYFALSKVSVSYAQTGTITEIFSVKYINRILSEIDDAGTIISGYATIQSIQVFTVLFAHFFFDEKLSRRVYISVTPIVLGVFIATATELQFDMLGLFSGLLSTGIFGKFEIINKLKIMNNFSFPECACKEGNG